MEIKPMDASDLLAIETLLFSNRIREAQLANPRAHRELINWGAWSRHLTGLKPVLAAPGWCRDYRASDWTSDEEQTEDLAVKQRREADPEVKAERGERPLYRQIAAETLDAFLHTHSELPWIRSRRCLSVAYVWCYPEHQYDTRASKGKDQIDKDTFLHIFSAALRLIEREGP